MLEGSSFPEWDEFDQECETDPFLNSNYIYYLGPQSEDEGPESYVMIPSGIRQKCACAVCGLRNLYTQLLGGLDIYDFPEHPSVYVMNTWNSDAGDYHLLLPTPAGMLVEGLESGCAVRYPGRHLSE